MTTLLIAALGFAAGLGVWPTLERAAEMRSSAAAPPAGIPVPVPLATANHLLDTIDVLEAGWAAGRDPAGEAQVLSLADLALARRAAEAPNLAAGNWKGDPA